MANGKPSEGMKVITLDEAMAGGLISSDPQLPQLDEGRDEVGALAKEAGTPMEDGRPSQRRITTGEEKTFFTAD